MSGGNITNNTTSGASSTLGNPGTNAMPIPATTRRIEGVMLSRLAAMATAASNAIMKSNVSTVAVMASRTRLYQVGDHVHGQREHRNIEKERDHAVHIHHPANDLAGDRHVGDLRGHRDDK